MLKILIFSTITFVGCSSGYLIKNVGNENVWSHVAQPTNSFASSIGEYSSGCIAGAVPLPKEGNNYQLLNPEKNRHFGHPKLTQFIARFAVLSPEKLLLGDMSQPRGGPMPNGHSSHQIGLDVDIFYDKEKSSLVSMDGKELLQEKWKKNYTSMLLLAAQDSMVDRVFVNAAIKKYLCKNFAHHAAVYKIRPWFFHDYHFHVRLKCPSDSPSCKSQESMSTNNGCDGTLEWWFTEEALSIWLNKSNNVVERTIELPNRCKEIINP
ncbi:MAG: penicillin-insensitive murein endopeptidase [Bacteriovoracaceae bacterium]